MKKIIIIHGWGGSSKNDWMPWLGAELAQRGHEVLVPDMPDTDAPTIEKWVGHLTEVVGTPDKNTFFVGHSIGCQTILRYLDSYDFKAGERVGGAIFVAGWFNLENMESEEEERIAEPWIETPINIEKIKTVLPHSTLIISDNDCYGAFEENKQKFSELGTRIVVKPGAGHFTAAEGWTEMPDVVAGLENIK